MAARRLPFPSAAQLVRSALFLLNLAGQSPAPLPPFPPACPPVADSPSVFTSAATLLLLLGGWASGCLVRWLPLPLLLPMLMLLHCCCFYCTLCCCLFAGNAIITPFCAPTQAASAWHTHTHLHTPLATNFLHIFQLSLHYPCFFFFCYSFRTTRCACCTCITHRIPHTAQCVPALCPIRREPFVPIAPWC